MAMRSWFLLLLIASGLSAGSAPGSLDPAESDLRFVLILSRHGVRSPTLRIDQLARFATDPWPQWEVPPGYLTPHGRLNMELMGAYYRAYYTSQGLLSGRPDTDGSRIFFRADSDERTIASAQALAAGLIPSFPVRVHALPQGQPGDPLLNAYDTYRGHWNPGVVKAAILGRIGGDPRLLAEEARPTIEALERILLGRDGAPPSGKVSLFDLPISVDVDENLFWQAYEIVEAFTLEYADAMPLQEVGWGRVTEADIKRLAPLDTLFFDLYSCTPYLAQIQASDLADHILATLEQAALGRPVTGAIGSPGGRMAILVGHDDNIIPLGKLLDIGWRVPGAAANLALPGGALVFELRCARGDGRLLVRTRFVSETLEQMRDAAPLTLENPPAAEPIFVPGCSLASPGYDAPLDLFAVRLRLAIDPAFTSPEPPGVR